MPNINSLTFAAIDFESAGQRSGQNDLPVQIGITLWSLPLGLHQDFVSYIACDQPITWNAQKIHGISPNHLLTAPSLLSLWPNIREKLHQRPIVAHNRGTEKKFLRTFPGHGFTPWLDTLWLARAAWPHLQNHSLSSICEHFQLHLELNQRYPNRQWHDALYDAAASLLLLNHLIHEFSLQHHPLDSLLQPNTSLWHQNRHN